MDMLLSKLIGKSINLSAVALLSTLHAVTLFAQPIQAQHDWQSVHLQDYGFSHKVFTLLGDLEKYTTTARGHWGNVRQHSVWTADAVIDLLNDPSYHFLAEGLGRSEVKIAVASALIHDIGKGGDGVVNFLNKQIHPNTGFDYLLGKKPYKLVNGTLFSPASVFTLNVEEQKIVATLVGHHYNFGDIRQKFLKAKAPGSHEKVPMTSAEIRSMNDTDLSTNLKPFFHNLKTLAQEAGIPRVSESLVRMSIVVGLADIRGSSPDCNPALDGLANCKEYVTHPDTYVNWERFDYSKKNSLNLDNLRGVHDALVAYYKHHQSEL